MILHILQNFFLFDVPAFSSVEIVGAVVGFIVLIGAAVGAFIVWTMLKRTLKMAVRMTIVIALLLIALVGGVSLWWFAQGNSAAKRPSPTRPAKP